MKDPKLQIAIDRGGTFTDVWAKIPGKGEIIFKLLSEDPSNYEDAPTEGVRRVMEVFSGDQIPKGTKLDGSLIEWIRMGTTVGTNALLEKKGDKFLYVTTENLGDVLEIGTQARPELFNLNVKKPTPLYTEILEVEERVTIENSSDDPNQTKICHDEKERVFLTKSGIYIKVLKELNIRKTTEKLEEFYRKGYRNIAVCLAHSSIYDKHEQEIKHIAAEIGYEYISLSSELATSMGLLQRGNSACINAYLTPTIQKYVKRFSDAFKNPPIIDFMKSDGGLVKAEDLNGLNSILSGPAGGAVGFAKTSYDGKTPVLGFDMGGTSTDVCRFDHQLEVIYENKIAGVDVVAPQLQIHTVAAGGGSVLKFENGLFHVGPESSSSNPGPACYRKGGPLTITDANLVLKRLELDQFPRIFGPNANEPLDQNVTEIMFQELTDKVNYELKTNFTKHEVAIGFLEVANEKMARSIREISEARGFSTNDHILAAFGGAGGQHCCAVARILGIKTVVQHKYSSILSSYGMALAEKTNELKRPYDQKFLPETLQDCQKKLEEMSVECSACFTSGTYSEDTVKPLVEKSVGLRFKGSNTIIQIFIKDESDYSSVVKSFLQTHKREFGFLPPLSTDVLVNYIRVKSSLKADSDKCDYNYKAEVEQYRKNGLIKPVPSGQQSIYFGKHPTVTNLYHLKDLKDGMVIEGPALLTTETQTLLVEEGCTAILTANYIVIEIGNNAEKGDLSTQKLGSIEIDNPAMLSVFGNRFMGIAEQMGRTLQRTSISTSIKERLDFSCAIFSSDGGLVANAPHIPVHLGSMQYAIEYQHKLWKGRLKPGDVLLSNHPEAGGTHLPDLTVITPVFDKNEVVFYVASRGHHQDIGGIGITAMIPNSKELWQEGVSIKSFKVVKEGAFDEDGIRELFEIPAKFTGSSATRNIENNISDLKAQVSANQRGINLLYDLIKEYGFPLVEYNMKSIRKNAENVVRDFLRNQARINSNKIISAVDYFDDGTPIKVQIKIDGEKGEAFFDFEGTGEEVYGCMNSPPSITYSCVIYVLRCLIDKDIPLNQGCLTPCTFNIPKGSILNPTEFVAVCGSTISGQRITDVILKAFGSCAASQGCANSFGFGTGGKDPLTGESQKGFTYAEAIGGGVGAGPWGCGADACNVHCTNTRTTDIEIIEARTPVIITEWKIRKGSGGKGRYYGGNGCVREIEARIPLRVSILSERRVFAPYGLEGGEDGARGLNFWFRKKEDGSYAKTRIGSKEIFHVSTGDRVQINTPGGGGYGLPT